jgi:hypothetical protein
LPLDITILVGTMTGTAQLVAQELELPHRRRRDARRPDSWTIWMRAYFKAVACF